MAFDQQIVYGLCNVLNKHLAKGNLSLNKVGEHFVPVEHWAKRMDLSFREFKADLEFAQQHSELVVKNLRSIDNSYSNLIAELYKVSNHIQREISCDIEGSDFLKLRLQIRKNFDCLKNPITKVMESTKNGIRLKINADSVAAIEAGVDTWFSLRPGKKRVPKKLNKGTEFFRFLKDCLETFEIGDEVLLAYENWYNLIHRAN